MLRVLIMLQNLQNLKKKSSLYFWEYFTSFSQPPLNLALYSYFMCFEAQRETSDFILTVLIPQFFSSPSGFSLCWGSITLKIWSYFQSGKKFLKYLPFFLQEFYSNVQFLDSFHFQLDGHSCLFSNGDIDRAQRCRLQMWLNGFNAREFLSGAVNPFVRLFNLRLFI